MDDQHSNDLRSWSEIVTQQQQKNSRIHQALHAAARLQRLHDIRHRRIGHHALRHVHQVRIGQRRAQIQVREVREVAGQPTERCRTTGTATGRPLGGGCSCSRHLGETLLRNGHVVLVVRVVRIETDGGGVGVARQIVTLQLRVGDAQASVRLAVVRIVAQRHATIVGGRLVVGQAAQRRRTVAVEYRIGGVQGDRTALVLGGGG